MESELGSEMVRLFKIIAEEVKAATSRYVAHGFSDGQVDEMLQLAHKNFQGVLDTFAESHPDEGLSEEHLRHVMREAYRTVPPILGFGDELPQED